MLTLGALKAIETLNRYDKGFVLMIEGSQIDWACHNNDSAYLVAEMEDFEDMLNAVLDFAERDGQTLVVVTADHETGGLTLLKGSIEEGVSRPTWATGGHSGVMVPVFSFGPGANLFSGVMQNTDFRLTFFPIRTLKNGTNTIYTEDMKPDFPALTVSSPICCVFVPIIRKAPHMSPAMSDLRYLRLTVSFVFREVSKYPLFLRPGSTRGTSTADAISMRTALNVIGGMTVLPIFCAMNPEPHSMAVRSSAAFPFMRSLMSPIIRHITLYFQGSISAYYLAAPGCPE